MRQGNKTTYHTPTILEEIPLMYNTSYFRLVTFPIHLNDWPNLPIRAGGELDPPKDWEIVGTRDEGTEWRVEEELHFKLMREREG